MSYNLLLDTNFSKIGKHWKLTNCRYQDGYLVSDSKVYSIEQKIALPNATKVYFSMDYILFDKNVKKIYVGIQCGDVLHTTVVKPRIDSRNRVSVVYPVKCESITVKFIVESTTSDNTKLYIDSPLLIDVHEQGKDFWPRWMLDKIFDYRYGYEYDNLYKQCEISVDNEDFISPYIDTQEAHVGIIAKIKESDWFELNFSDVLGNYYLIKVDLEQVNNYGDLYLLYGEFMSDTVDDKGQLYMTYRSDGKHKIRIKMKNEEKLDYMINLKRVLIVDITNKHFEEKDIPHLAFI